MRSLSMRIANPHLITKKSKFGYPTKKFKAKKSNLELTPKIENDLARQDQESSSLLVPPDSVLIKKRALIAIEEDSKSYK
jgi:hypothetical protein